MGYPVIGGKWQCGWAALILLGLSVSGAGAHEPSRMDIFYDPAEEALTITVYHDVEPRTRHFINRYEIRLNKGAPLRYRFQRQESPAVSRLEVQVPAEPGDVFSVTAWCNQRGRLTEPLILTEAAWDAGQKVYTTLQDFASDSSGRYRNFGILRYHHHHHAHPIVDSEADNPAVESQAVSAPFPLRSPSNPRQKVLAIEQQIRRQAYEARFGPLKTPESSSQK